ncbi:unnamed protein product [Bursaphelenchus xylophilus]|uniref:(pine wood nematode) hypothetical protein n=1 Tax=Bursaphelenchus xylophilus TaxID=6326 RepID=A0A1I7RU82_BURXY|nr:unnamed protein product [Bursaphelenchus xylophilus]CAG9113912.1 unnamed protein product [Bursaphelenchus xylophilus]
MTETPPPSETASGSGDQTPPNINSPRPDPQVQPGQNTLAMLKNHKSSDDEEDEKIIKVVILGDGTCGKTSLCTRFAQRDFTGKYAQTIGVDFFNRRIAMPHGVNVLFQLWDIGGQSLSTNMLGKYIYDADCIVFVYDVTNSASFDSVTDWVGVVKKINKHQEKGVHMALVGNKTDLEHRRTVRIDKHTRFADQYVMSSHYVSAKTGDSVDLSFKLIAAEVMGIQLTKTDVELAINTVEAPVAVLDDNAPHREPEIAKKTNIPQVHGTVTTHTAEEVDTTKDYTKESKVCSVM